MADLNALIAQGAQFRAPPDPFEQYGRMQQLEQGRQTNQLNRMKMGEYQRGVETQNRLRELDPSSPDYLTQVSKIDPKTGFEFGKLRREEEAAKLTQQKSQLDIKISRQKLVSQALRDISQNPSDAQIGAHFEDITNSGLFGPQELQQLQSNQQQLLAMPYEQRKLFLASQGASPGELKPTLTPQNLGATTQIMSTPAFGGQAGVVPGSSQQVTMTPGQAEANRIAEARLAQGDRRIGLLEEKTAAGPKPPELKQVPVHAQKAIVGAATAVKKLDDAIKALEAPGGADATGLKSYLPDVALNRLYPKGTEARAAVADIGSLVMHERSGAAVTASESPRLKPFIPLITDDKATALKKLKRMRQIQADDAEALAGTYVPEQGFREFKPGGTAPVPAGGALSPAEQAELDQLRARFKK